MAPAAPQCFDRRFERAGCKKVVRILTKSTSSCGFDKEITVREEIQINRIPFLKVP